MIHELLTRLERDPSAVFYDKELRARFPSALDQAIRDRLLRRVPIELNGGRYSFGLSRPWTILSTGDGIIAFNDEDPEDDPIPLQPDDLLRWRLDLLALGQRIQEVNALTGRPEALDHQLLFIGHGTDREMGTAVVLGLFANDTTARSSLAALPGLLATTFTRFVVVCPAFEPAPSLLRHLEGLHISMIHPAAEDVFSLPLPRTADSEATTSAQYLFRNDGDIWTIRFAGKTVNLKDRKGLHYIAHLLQHPDTDIHVTTLEDLLLRRQASPGVLAGMSGEELAGIGLTVSDLGDAGEILDRQALQEYRQRLRDIDDELQEAEEFHDIVRKADLVEERDALLQQIGGGAGLGGRIRRARSSVDQARVRVRKQISGALAPLQRSHPELGAFLKNAVRTGTTCVYHPDRPIPWKFE